MSQKARTIRKVWKKLGKPAAIDARCTEKHLREIELHLSRWESFWSGDKEGCAANHVDTCKRSHLEKYRRHLLETDLSTRTINKHLGTIRKILIVAEKHELIDSRPRLEQIHEPVNHSKLFIRDEQIELLFAAADRLRWPNVGLAPGDFWRCALVMYRTYGFRTQELLAYESSKKPITWQSISFDNESPNPASEERCEYGWLSYVPPKTQKKKPMPIFLPLTKFTRKAMEMMLSVKLADDSPIFCNPRNQSKFFNEWYRWLEMAGVQPKCEDSHFIPYCLRKTCATYMNRHREGLATAICRWGSSGEAQVASKHYISDELILRAIHDAPMPKCFDEFLGGDDAQAGQLLCA